jgi:hypothetical protein
MGMMRRHDWHRQPIFWLVGVLILLGQTLVNTHHASHAEPDGIPHQHPALTTQGLQFSTPVVALPWAQTESTWSHQAGDAVCKIWLGLGVATTTAAALAMAACVLPHIAGPAPDTSRPGHALRARAWPRAPPWRAPTAHH